MTTPSRASLPQLPLGFTTNPASITQTADEACADARAAVDELLASVTPATATFDNVLGTLLRLENQFQRVANVAVVRALTGGVRVGDTGGEEAATFKTAAGQAADKLNNFLADLKAEEMVGALVKAVYEEHQHDSGARLDTESWKALSEEHRSHALNGGLSFTAELQNKAVVIAKRISDLKGEFLDNLNNGEDCLWLTMAELEGVSEVTLNALKAGSAEFGGKFKVDLGGPHVRSILSQLALPATRQAVYIGMKTLAKGNIPLFQELVKLRHQAARSRGYPSYTAYRVEAMMAKTPAAVDALLKGLRDRALAQLPRDLEKLSGMSQERGQPPGAMTWADLPYYTRLYEQQNLSVDQDLIAQHFPLLPTVSKMLGLFGKLFGFVFRSFQHSSRREPQPGDPVLSWHQDVLIYSVWNDDLKQQGDSSSGFAGWLYLDLHPREGKVGGAQCRPLELGYHVGETPQERHYPSTVLLTNFARDSILAHADVTLLFHELGHGIHDLAGRCTYSRFHGAETAGDFNEAPSQMLENWCWDASALRYLSGHHQTGDPLPDDAIAAIIASRAVLPAVKLMEQLRMTLFDNAVHAATDVDTVFFDVDKIYAEFANLGGLGCDGDRHGYTTYRHLCSGNDGTMYSYLWSRAVAQDMYDAFFASNTLDSKVGRRYRHMVLEKGGSQAEMETLVGYLGRRPSFDAFYQSLGL
ncbi:metallopeptidase MepB [Microdochium nivale]|nr:metallopeptidase MepB [Microdochium nivale]